MLIFYFQLPQALQVQDWAPLWPHQETRYHQGCWGLCLSLKDTFIQRRTQWFNLHISRSLNIVSKNRVVSPLRYSYYCIAVLLILTHSLPVYSIHYTLAMIFYCIQIGIFFSIFGLWRTTKSIFGVLECNSTSGRLHAIDVIAIRSASRQRATPCIEGYWHECLIPFVFKRPVL